MRGTRLPMLALALAAGCSRPLVLTIGPAEVELQPGSTVQLFAHIDGGDAASVTFAVAEAAGGTITPGGLYTAPAVTGEFHVLASLPGAQAVPADVHVRAAPAEAVSVAVTPASAHLPARGAISLAATVAGAREQQTRFAVAEGLAGGSVTADGLYTAPAAGGVFHVVAISVADPSQSASATITVDDPSAVGVFVAPALATVDQGAVVQLVASVTNSADARVTWSVLRRGDEAVGSITGGFYLAPAAAGAFTVVATSVADPSKSGTATIHVRQVSVAAAGAAQLGAGAASQLAAAVAGTTDGRIAWSVLEGAEGGTITPGGLYQAPATTGTFHAVATSVADPSQSAITVVAVGSALAARSATAMEVAKQPLLTASLRTPPGRE